MKFLLDTDTCIHAIKHNPSVRANMSAHSPMDIAISVVTECELRAGAAKSQHPKRTTRLLENFLAPLSIIEYTSDDAVLYAKIRAALERAGTPIGPLDTLIAGHAVARKLMLVTHNQREFSRVDTLELTDWIDLRERP